MVRKTFRYSIKRFFNALIASLKPPVYLKGNWRSIFVWPAIILVLIMIGWGILLGRLAAEKQGIEHFAHKESATLAEAYGDHLARNFDVIDQIALHVKYEWELSRGTLRLEQIRQRGLFPSSELVLVTIVGRDGMPVTSTVPFDKPANLADRAHFKIHKESASDILYISKVLTGRLSGLPVIQFSRRLAAPDGMFDGVVVVSVDPAYLALAFDFSGLGMNGVLAAVGKKDNDVRISRIGKVASSPDFPALTKIPDMSAPRGSMELDDPQYFIDKRSRFLGWKALNNYPFIAVAGLDKEEVMAPYRADRAAYIRLAIMATGVALAIALLAILSAAQLARERYRVKVVRDAYRMATDVGKDGFFICEAVYDQQGELTDFVLVDCNRTGAAMMGKERQDLLNLRLSALCPGPVCEELLELGKKAMELGFYEVESKVRPNSPVRAKWVNRKLIRSGDSIAVTIRDISEAKQHLEELERRGNQDALTSLHNRHWLHSFLPAALKRAEHEKRMLALLFIDIDGFKAVNDSMGHAAGDELLRIAASRLQSVIRPEDKIVRLGGDEFLIVLEHIEQQSDASHISKRVLEIFGEKFKLKQGVHTVGVSVGISVFPNDGKDAKTLLQNADVAMYSAKQSGKGQSRFYDPVFYDSLRARLEMERKLRDAVDLDQFEMFYQPRVDMETGRVCGLEALIRWNDPEYGLVEPVRFIAVAEETGLILSLGTQAMEKVCAQIAQWSRDRQKCVPISINVSPRQFHEGNLKSIMAQCLARYEVPADLVEIEVTESSMMGETAEISTDMKALQQLGVKLLVDDFGTGYSSLSQLQRLDMDGLKIDRAFTSELGRSKEGEVFFSAIVTMAHALGMRVVAEGVETRQQVEILKRLACDEIQGYYVSRPVPAKEIPALMESRMPVEA